MCHFFSVREFLDTIQMALESPHFALQKTALWVVRRQNVRLSVERLLPFLERLLTMKDHKQRDQLLELIQGIQRLVSYTYNYEISVENLFLGLLELDSREAQRVALFGLQQMGTERALTPLHRYQRRFFLPSEHRALVKKATEEIELRINLPKRGGLSFMQEGESPCGGISLTEHDGLQGGLSEADEHPLTS